MKLIYNKIFLEHNTGMHPENRKRLESLGPLPQTEIESGEPFLSLIHSQAHIEHIKEASKTSEHIDPDTVASPGSYEAAIKAVGATIMASQTNDFAVVRPPGHHAYPDRASGFCLFNNIAIATQKLVNEGKRVLIFDFDSHLGDGTSAIFYDTDQVLYWSLHQYPAFPGRGFIDEIGRDKGRGYTVNVPLPPGSGDDLFMKAVDQLMPIAEQFKPDHVGISAGFDGHQYDLLLDLRLTVNSYYEIGSRIQGKFENTFATLEGGYNIEMLPKCIHNFVDGMNGKQPSFHEEPTTSAPHVVEEFEGRFQLLKKILSEFWKL